MSSDYQMSQRSGSHVRRLVLDVSILCCALHYDAWTCIQSLAWVANRKDPYLLETSLGITSYNFSILITLNSTYVLQIT